MVYAGHNTESIYEQIPLYENTVIEHQQLTAKQLLHNNNNNNNNNNGPPEPVYEDARNARKFCAIQHPQEKTEKEKEEQLMKEVTSTAANKCTYVKCCVTLATAVSLVAFVPLIYFLVDVAVKHDHLKGRYEQLKTETDQRYESTAAEGKLATESLLQLSEQKYRQLSMKMNRKYDTLKAQMSTMYKDVNLKRDCLEILQIGQCKNGVHTIRPNTHTRNIIRVFCDQEHDGGGWTVFQRRDHSPTVSFKRSWDDYKRGFGDIAGSFWLGNDNLHALTNMPNTTQELRIDLEDWNGVRVYAKYSVFRVHDEDGLYRIQIGGYSGTAGDGMGDLDGMTFGTRDRDTDKCSCDCSRKYGEGGWWFRSCFAAHLNGKYCEPRDLSCGRCHNLNWQTFRNCSVPLKRTEMKIRRFEELSLDGEAQGSSPN